MSFFSGIVMGILIATVLATPPSREQLEEEMYRVLRTAQPKGENGWPEIVKIHRRLEAIERSIEDELADPSSTTRDGAWYHVLEKDDEFARPYARELVEQTLDSATSEGLFSRLRDVLNEFDRFEVPQTSVGSQYEYVPIVRELCRALRGAAIWRAEHGEFRQMMMHLTLLFRFVDEVSVLPGAVGLLVAIANEERTLGAVRWIILHHALPVPVLEALIGEIGRIRTVDPQVLYDAAVLEYLSMIRPFYGDDGAVVAEEVEATRDAADEVPFGGLEDGFLGDLPQWDQLMPIAERYWVVVDELLRLDPSIRSTIGEKETDERLGPGPLMLRQVAKSIVQWQKIHDRFAMEWDATTIVLAIEIHHAREGILPRRLDDLVPDILHVLPHDSLANQPFRYRPVENDPRGREYLVWSVGRDGIDNNGRPDPDSPLRAWSEDYREGIDYVINRVD